MSEKPIQASIPGVPRATWGRARGKARAVACTPSGRAVVGGSLERYSRQVLLPDWGREGQERLARKRAVVVGCGALGSHIANHLARAGVGHLTVVDRDLVEWHNLPRQVLYVESDADEGIPKAVAAARRLRQINSTIAVTGHVADVNPDTVEELVAAADVVMDGADNFELRYLVNEACVKHGVPWVYGGVLGTYGLCAPILPGETPCLRCLLGAMPAPGSVPTCETAGVLGPTVAVIAALQVTEGLKILLEKRQAVLRSLAVVDLWAGSMERAEVRKGGATCPVCDLGQFELLGGDSGASAVVLCGRDAVQVRVRPARSLDLVALADRLEGRIGVRRGEHVLRLEAEKCELMVFPDGRSIVKGTSDPARARALYARYVGS